MTALNLKFKLKSLEFWFKTHSWSGGQLNLLPKAREDEIVSEEWFEAFTSAMKSNARLISRSWVPQERGEGQRAMSQRWSREEGFAQDGSGERSVCVLVAHSSERRVPREQPQSHIGALQPKAGPSSPRLAHATLPRAERDVPGCGVGGEVEEVGEL